MTEVDKVVKDMEDERQAKRVKKLSRLALIKKATFERLNRNKKKKPVLDKVNEAVSKVLSSPQPTAKAKAVHRVVLDEAKLLKKYPHMVPGTLRHDEKAGKNVVQIKCVDDGKKRDVYTSDLFQVKRCFDCARAHKSKAKNRQRSKFETKRKK